MPGCVQEQRGGKLERTTWLPLAGPQSQTQWKNTVCLPKKNFFHKGNEKVDNAFNLKNNTSLVPVYLTVWGSLWWEAAQGTVRGWKHAPLSYTTSPSWEHYPQSSSFDSMCQTEGPRAKLGTVFKDFGGNSAQALNPYHSSLRLLVQVSPQGR